MSTRATNEIEMRNRGRVEQSQWLKLWHDAAQFCCPHLAQAVRSSGVAQDTAFRPSPQRTNSVAIDSVNVLAGGCKSWITPGPASGWWQWEPSPDLANQVKVKDWLADCTDRADRALEAGGFYTAAHEAYLHLGVFGTAGLFVEKGESLPLVVRSLQTSDFVFFTSWEGAVERVIVTYTKTAKQIHDQFGPSACPETVRADVASNRGEAKHEVIHSIYKRPEGEVKAPRYPDDPEGMAFASCWIHVASKHILREGGFDEMPMAVPRWEKFPGAGEYGVSPAMKALADIRGVNLLDMLMGTLAEKAVNPPILNPTSNTSAIDLSPGGVTSFSDVSNAPREWAHQGRFDVGVALIERKEQQIRRAFHADLFERLAPIEREMTRYEVQARERESLSRISPAMSRLATDLINPTMRRVFMVLYRQGYFAPPPDEAFYYDQAGKRYLLFPRVVQTSRMAAALNNRKAFAFENAMARVLPLVQVDPNLLKLYKLETIMRDLDRGDGMPPEWHLDEDEYAQLLKAMADQMQAQQAQAQALELAGKQPELVAAAAQAAGVVP